MKLRQKITALITVIASLLMIAPSLAGTEIQPTSAATHTPLSYLFVQSANSALLKPIDQKSGQYTLRLRQLNPYVTYFSDRPNRITGAMPTAKFLNLWQKNQHDSFAKSAPNASIAGTTLHFVSKNKSVFFVAELSAPTFNKQKNELTYRVKVLGEQKNLGSQKTIAMDHVILFLDNWCPSCCCGV